MPVRDCAGLQPDEPRPRRSILFLFVTGEDEGLLGEDVIARGGEHSTLGAAVHEAAARLNIDVSPDPHPERVLFIRSDQYSFVRQGIPSVFPHSGIKSSNPNVKPDEIQMTWLKVIIASLTTT